MSGSCTCTTSKLFLLPAACAPAGRASVKARCAPPSRETGSAHRPLADRDHVRLLRSPSRRARRCAPHARARRTARAGVRSGCSRRQAPSSRTARRARSSWQRPLDEAPRSSAASPSGAASPSCRATAAARSAARPICRSEGYGVRSAASSCPLRSPRAAPRAVVPSNVVSRRADRLGKVRVAAADLGQVVALADSAAAPSPR